MQISPHPLFLLSPQSQSHVCVAAVTNTSHVKAATLSFWALKRRGLRLRQEAEGKDGEDGIGENEFLQGSS